MASKLGWATPLALLIGCGGGSAPPANVDPAITAGLAADSTNRVAAAAADSTTKAHQRKVVFDTAAASGKRPLVRETYSYEGSARDPFRPLTVSADRGPELPNLTLTAIIFDNRVPSNSIATFREKGSDRRYVWHPGERFGRITVTRMTSTDVTLELNDFGVPRRQTYSLRKPEDQNP